MFRYILPICLPPSNLPITGKRGFVTGWGKIYENGPNPPVPNQVIECLNLNNPSKMDVNI